MPHVDNQGATSLDHRVSLPATAEHTVTNATEVTIVLLASIVVPTCGRPDLLNRCIASLVMQQFDFRAFEIIIVDDAPSDATRDIVNGWAAQMALHGPEVRYVASTGPHGPAAARNRGWRSAQSTVIGFTDDDTVAAPDWLRRGYAEIRNGAQAVWGRIVMPLTGVPTDYELDAKGLERAEFVTANCFCETALLEQLQGFDERFRMAWREDADFYFRLLDQGMRVVHAPSVVMVHPIRPAKWGVSLSQQKKILFDALLFKKHPARYRQKIRSSPRWDYYVTVVLLMAVVVGIIANAPAVAAGAGAMWLLMTARFCLQRLRHTARNAAHVVEMAVTSALIPPTAVFWRMVGAWKFRVPFI